MAVSISVDPRTRTVVSTFSGTVTIVDFLTGRDGVAKHADFAATFAHVLDFTSVTAVDIEPSTLRDLLAMPSIFETDALQVVVAPTTSPIFPMARTFKTIAEGTGRNIRIAENRDEARALVIALG